MKVKHGYLLGKVYCKVVLMYEILLILNNIRDMFHVYLNRSEFDFLWLHIIKTHKFGFVIHNERVPVKSNRKNGNLKHIHNTVALNTSPPPFI